ncbi:MAG: WecB/TagA/CpsF family glycosyltransferase [Burkholderiaceae bacterium]
MSAVSSGETVELSSAATLIPTSQEPVLSRVDILGVDIDAITWAEALSRIATWVERRDSRSIAVCNVHSVVTAKWDPAFSDALRQADLAVPDGMPLVWFMRGRGVPSQTRINGPDLMIRLCYWAQQHQQSVFLYGTTPETLARLEGRLYRRFPKLRIAGTLAPPFRSLTESEDAGVVELINASGAGIVFVALGCPKQEKWVQEHVGRINAVMIGVGVAFDYYSGNVRRAPRWMQRSGLEWAFRLVNDPRRLWKRYLVTNSVFVARVIMSNWRRRT